MKFIAVLILVIVLLFVSSCSNVNSNNIFSPSDDEELSDAPSISDVEEFIELLKGSDYNKAIELYNVRILGDYTLESTASYEFEALFEGIILQIWDGQLTVSEAELKAKMMNKVVSETRIKTDNYKTLLAKMTGAISSKKSFDVAVQLEELKNYEDAAKEYSKVNESDSNYVKAVEGLSRCFSSIKNKYFEAAQIYAKNSNYLKAIEELDYLKEMFSYDDEVIATISTYENAYIQDIISKSEKVFLVPESDYEAAIGEINKGLQHFKNNENLIAKKEYYETFAPVYIYDMEEIKGNPNKKNTDNDRYGNVYSKCFISNGSGMNYNTKSDATYFLNCEYNTFSATVYGKSKSNLAGKMTIEIYADEKLAYQKLNWPDNSSAVLNIKIDITGVREIRIVLKGQHSYAGIGMTDMVVQKTVS